MDSNEVIIREIEFRNWLKENMSSSATLSTYPLALKEKIPQKLKSIGEKEYSNFFACNDILYLDSIYKRLMKGGDLHQFNVNTQSRLPSASISRYKEFIAKKSYNSITPIENLLNIKENIDLPIKNFGNLTFPHKNLLLKGVPGTGKSRAIENIINNKLNLKNHKENILRINIHSASSNADLMQGIGISSKNGQIEYKEKQGLILNLIERATLTLINPLCLYLKRYKRIV